MLLIYSISEQTVILDITTLRDSFFFEYYVYLIQKICSSFDGLNNICTAEYSTSLKPASKNHSLVKRIFICKT
ncbi:hypothetical protein HIE71_004443 [Escherichia coli]|nr:hypothetical protein [Escherichia coli]EEW4293513.1 hypothetical protein [Escherichia coli]EFD0788525.1 hypothetical protein [Escherichia coli]EFD0796942.1 hypothetical protein [Escherichia coli]EFD1613016.1 hypothetical protein [Escherichia coli]